MRPLTVAELERHPEYPYVTLDLKPDQKGTIAVAEGRGGPINIVYEIHGHGPKRLVWIMGLGGQKSSWQRQTKDFGHTKASEYTSLVFDNRGVGESDKPMMRYSTSEMARDTVELLNHVGWTAHRSIHVIGISMGGMIAQELGLLIPDRIASLSLLSTAARLINTIGYFEHLRNRINLFIPKSLDVQINNAKHMLYTDAYLASPDTAEYTVEPFPTSGDRFGASELAKRRNPEAFTRTGFICQALAAGWHHKTPDQVAELADRVGRGRIMVVHGTEDRMITVPHGEVLVEELNAGGKSGEGVRKEFFERLGHVMPIERREDFMRLVEEMVEKCESSR